MEWFMNGFFLAFGLMAAVGLIIALSVAIVAVRTVRGQNRIEREQEEWRRLAKADDGETHRGG